MANVLDVGVAVHCTLCAFYSMLRSGLCPYWVAEGNVVHGWMNASPCSFCFLAFPLSHCIPLLVLWDK